MGHFLPHETVLSPGGLRRYRLDGLNRTHAESAVRRPLAGTARSFGPGVAEDLVDRIIGWTTTESAGEVRSVVDPARLQVVCLALWRSLDDGVDTITSEVVDACFDDAGDVDATLTTFCVRAVMDVTAAHDVSELDVWAWLERTFITELGTCGSAPQGASATAGMPNAVVEAFEEHRILRSEPRAGALWFELQHDVLIEPIRSGHRLAEGLAAGDANAATADARPEGAAVGVGAEAFLRVARRALRDGLLPLAEEYARGAIRAGELDPRRLAEANVFLGELVLGQVRASAGSERVDELYDTAEHNFRRAAELFDAEQDVRAVGQQQASLGRLFLERGRYTDALAELRGALDRLRGDLGVRMDFARALSRSGLMQAAVGEYTAVLMFVPEDAPTIRTQALLARGVLEAEHGDPAAALHDLDDAVRSQPDLGRTPDVTAARARAAERLAWRRPPPVDTGTTSRT
jgi:tetratricopeptide (TPR) repeat protein